MDLVVDLTGDGIKLVFDPVFQRLKVSQSRVGSCRIADSGPRKRAWSTVCHPVTLALTLAPPLTLSHALFLYAGLCFSLAPKAPPLQAFTLQPRAPQLRDKLSGGVPDSFFGTTIVDGP